MKLGMIGLGRMGSNMVRRLLGAGHECVVFDVEPKASLDLAKAGAIVARSLAELVAKLEAPRGDEDFANQVLSALRYRSADTRRSSHDAYRV